MKEKIYLTNNKYFDWTFKFIKEDFGLSNDGDDWKWVEITDIGNNKVNFVAITEDERTGPHHGKEDVYDIKTISESKTFEELKQEILKRGPFYDQNMKVIRYNGMESPENLPDFPESCKYL